jgi:dTDP-4-dehydrorhamnose 3,5-epimerase
MKKTASNRVAQFQAKKPPPIQGVETKKLTTIADERGMLMEILRRDDAIFMKFGQVYVTTAFPGVVKAWHYHRVQLDNFCCLAGQIKLVLYDDRKESPTRGAVNEFFLGPRNPLVVRVPPLVFHGFKGTGTVESLVMNVSTEVYRHGEPDEYRVPYDDPSIPYAWDLKHG